MLRLLSYNIRFGGTGRETSLAETIRAAAPDLVVLQEATRPDVVARLAEATGMSQWASTRGHSVAFMSRQSVERYAWHQPPPCRRAFLEIVLPPSEARVFGVHLSAVNASWAERHRGRELEAMLTTIKDLREGPHALAGDFNTLAPGERLDWSRLPLRLRLLALLGGKSIRWQTVQILLDAGYEDGFRQLHPDDKGPTFPTWDPHVRLDYVFVPAKAKDCLRRCEVVGGPASRTASDHFPLIAELEL